MTNDEKAENDSLHGPKSGFRFSAYGKSTCRNHHGQLVGLGRHAALRADA